MPTAKQFYQCQVCQHERQFGKGTDIPESRTVTLHCQGCHGAVLHSYIGYGFGTHYEGKVTIMPTLPDGGRLGSKIH